MGAAPAQLCAEAAMNILRKLLDFIDIEDKIDTGILDAMKVEQWFVDESVWVKHCDICDGSKVEWATAATSTCCSTAATRRGGTTAPPTATA